MFRTATGPGCKLIEENLHALFMLLNNVAFSVAMTYCIEQNPRNAAGIGASLASAQVVYH